MIVTEDAAVISALLRVGCAATAAMDVTGAVDQMRKDRALRIGRTFLDELDPHTDEEAST